MTKPKIKKILIYGVLAVAIIGAAIYIFLIQREKAQFNQAEKEIDALYAQIVEKVGKPDQEKKEKSCDRPNLKFDKGPLSCFVGKYLLYENKSASTSTEILNRIFSLGTGSLRHGSAAATGASFSDSVKIAGDQRFFQDLATQSSLSCNFSYTYPSIEQDEFIASSPSALVIGISCYRPALLEYFPLKD